METERKALKVLHVCEQHQLIETGGCLGERERERERDWCCICACMCTVDISLCMIPHADCHSYHEHIINPSLLPLQLGASVKS